MSLLSTTVDVPFSLNAIDVVVTLRICAEPARVLFVYVMLPANLWLSVAVKGRPLMFMSAVFDVVGNANSQTTKT